MKFLFQDEHIILFIEHAKHFYSIPKHLNQWDFQQRYKLTFSKTKKKCGYNLFTTEKLNTKFFMPEHEI